MSSAAETTAVSSRMAKSIMALPPLPSTAQRILTCFGDEFIDADNVADVVQGDPGICAKLLGLANSAYFGLSEPVNDVGEAISRVLGVDTVRSLVLAMAIQQSFNSGKCPEFDVRRFWEISIRAAECCKMIASCDKSSDDVERDLAYSAGLCHNLGLMALSHIEPKRTGSVLKQHAAEGQANSLAGLFQLELETDHKIMTAELARAWSLPRPMEAAYRFRKNPDEPCEDRLGLVVAAGVAAVENTELGDDQRTPLQPWSEQLGLDACDIERMAVFGDRQNERVQSLIGKLAR